MKITLYRYIFDEVWPTFLASLFVAVFIILAAQMLSVTELIINREVYPGHVLRMVIYLLPDIIAFALPAATLMAVLVAFLRLSADNEIIAFKSSGISIFQMLAPVVVLSFFALLLSGAVGIMAVPWGNKSFKDLLFRIAETKADLGIQERVFCEPFDNVTFYVNSFSSRQRAMKDVFVVDRRDESVTNTIIAEKGRILFDTKNRLITLQFVKGTIFMVEARGKSARSIRFNTYNLNIDTKDIMAALASRKKKPKELSVAELRGQLGTVTKGEGRYNELMVQLLEKVTIPIAVFFMGIIGVPLGAQLRARGRAAGIGASLVVFLSYYFCMAGMRSISEVGVIPPTVGVWIPNLFLLVCSIYLLRLAAKERTVPWLSKSAVQDFIYAKIGGIIYRTKGEEDEGKAEAGCESDPDDEILASILESMAEGKKPDGTGN